MPLPFNKPSPIPAPRMGQGSDKLEQQKISRFGPALWRAQTSQRQGQPLDRLEQQKISRFGPALWRAQTSQGQAQKTVTKDKPGFLERGSFRTHDSLIHEVRKDSYYKNVPTYDKKFTQKERINLVKELEKAGKGGMGGLTETRLGMAIKKFAKEKIMAGYHRDFKKVKVLDQKIKQAKVWKKLWDRQKK